MSATEAQTIVTGVDFVSVPTQDLERAVAFLRAAGGRGLNARVSTSGGEASEPGCG